MKKLQIPEKTQKIIDIVVTCIEAVVVIFAIILSAIIIANPSQVPSEVAKGNTKLLPVVTDSMDGPNKDSFKSGDLVVAKKPKDVLSLKEGQIITFRYNINGYEVLNTHRIIEVKDTNGDGKAETYVCQGDNPAVNGETQEVNPNNVLAVYKYHLKGVGKAIIKLQEPNTFLLAIVLPLAILFIWNVIIFVRMIIQWRVGKAQEAAANMAISAPVAEIDEEEIKRKAIEEYLARQAAAQSEALATPAEEAAQPEEPAESEAPVESEATESEATESEELATPAEEPAQAEEPAESEEPPQE